MSTPEDLLAEAPLEAAVAALAERNHHHLAEMTPAERDDAIAHWRQIAVAVLTAAGAALQEEPSLNGDEGPGRAVIVLEDSGPEEIAIHASFFPQLEDLGGGQVGATPGAGRRARAARADLRRRRSTRRLTSRPRVPGCARPSRRSSPSCGGCSSSTAARSWSSTGTSEYIRPAAAWFSSPEVREALGAVLSRPYDTERPGITEAAIERGSPLLMDDITRWPGAEALRRRLEDELPAEQARLTWELLRVVGAARVPGADAGRPHARGARAVRARLQRGGGAQRRACSPTSPPSRSTAPSCSAARSAARTRS